MFAALLMSRERVVSFYRLQFFPLPTLFYSEGSRIFDDIIMITVFVDIRVCSLIVGRVFENRATPIMRE